MLRSALIALTMIGSAAGTLSAQKPDSARSARPMAETGKGDVAKPGQARADTAKSPLAGRMRGSPSAPVTVY